MGGLDRDTSPWWVIVGPTAVGKSAVAEVLAERLQTGIVVADSRQVYRGMDIATGKPNAAARARVPRFLIDIIPPDEPFSAGRYRRAAESVIAELTQSGKTVVIEGGTGLYVKALLYGLWEGPPADRDFRSRLIQEEKDGGAGTLHRRLAGIDPDAARAIHPRDLPKLIRALEVHRLTGRPLSEIHRADEAARKSGTPRRFVGLRRERKTLYRRIEARVDAMLAQGLVEETERLLAIGLSPDLPSMQGLGYRQIVPYLQGKRSLDEAVAILKRDTRRYAKRQMTWFRADPKIHWLDLAPGETAAETAGRIIGLKKAAIML